MGLFSKSKPKPTAQAPVDAPPPYAPSSQTQFAPPSPPKQHINADTRALPEGWISQYDPTSQKFFYVYTPTALRQWEHPADRSLGQQQQFAPQPYAQQPYGQPYGQQPYYPQQQYNPYQQQYAQQPQYVVQQQQHQRSNGMGMGTMAAVGVGAGVLGFVAADAIFDDDGLF